MTNIRKCDIELAAELMLAMANPKRLEVLFILVQGDMTVGDIADRVGLSQSALSQHLAKLRAQQLVKTRKDGHMIFYSCRSPAARLILDALKLMFDATLYQRQPKAGPTLG